MHGDEPRLKKKKEGKDALTKTSLSIDARNGPKTATKRSLRAQALIQRHYGFGCIADERGRGLPPALFLLQRS